MFVGFGPQADFLDLDFRLRFPCFFLLLGAFIKEFADVGYFANGRGGAWGDLYQIELRFPGQAKGFIDRYDADVLAFGIDQPDFRDPNGFI